MYMNLDRQLLKLIVDMYAMPVDNRIIVHHDEQRESQPRDVDVAAAIIETSRRHYQSCQIVDIVQQVFFNKENDGTKEMAKFAINCMTFVRKSIIDKTKNKSRLENYEFWGSVSILLSTEGDFSSALMIDSALADSEVEAVISKKIDYQKTCESGK